jgi:PiT family inorganic phosphate transporter
MDLSLAAVFALVTSNPLLLVVVLLVLAVIVVNGATDAANAIATVVGTRSLPAGVAIAMAATCNFLGLIVMSFVSTAVADTISKMVNLSGEDSTTSLVVLCAAMVAIIVWGVTAWYFGIPTSQSHSLVAGLTGAAIAIHGFAAGVNWGEWMKVIYGLAVSVLIGFGLGWLIARIVGVLFRSANRRAAERFFSGAQIAAAAMLAFMHGAQDGQKFMSIAMMAIMLDMGVSGQAVSYPLWIMVACSLTMALGTACGGKRIIKSVAMEMTRLQKYQGFSAALAASLCILLATLTGLPVSTTATNTTAIMGVGAERRLSSVNWGSAKNMVLTWVITFPGCGLLGWAMAKLFLLFL